MSWFKSCEAPAAAHPSAQTLPGAAVVTLAGQLSRQPHPRPQLAAAATAAAWALPLPRPTAGEQPPLLGRWTLLGLRQQRPPLRRRRGRGRRRGSPAAAQAPLAAAGRSLGSLRRLLPPVCPLPSGLGWGSWGCLGQVPEGQCLPARLAAPTAAQAAAAAAGRRAQQLPRPGRPGEAQRNPAAAPAAQRRAGEGCVGCWVLHCLPVAQGCLAVMAAGMMTPRAAAQAALPASVAPGTAAAAQLAASWRRRAPDPAASAGLLGLATELPTFWHAWETAAAGAPRPSGACLAGAGRRAAVAQSAQPAAAAAVQPLHPGTSGGSAARHCCPRHQQQRSEQRQGPRPCHRVAGRHCPEGAGGRGGAAAGVPAPLPHPAGCQVWQRSAAGWAKGWGEVSREVGATLGCKRRQWQLHDAANLCGETTAGLAAAPPPAIRAPACLQRPCLLDLLFSPFLQAATAPEGQKARNLRREDSPASSPVPRAVEQGGGAQEPPAGLHGGPTSGRRSLGRAQCRFP